MVDHIWHTGNRCYNSDVTKKLKKKVLIGGLAAALLVAAVILYYRNNGNTTKGTTPGATETGPHIPTPQGGQPAPSSEPEKSSDSSSQAAPSQPASSFTITLARAGQIGRSVQIRALVDGVTTGQCKVSFSGPGASFFKTHDITFDGRTYTCGALDAATSEFSKSGTWNYSLKATSGSAVSNTITGQITVSK